MWAAISTAGSNEMAGPCLDCRGRGHGLLACNCLQTLAKRLSFHHGNVEHFRQPHRMEAVNDDFRAAAVSTGAALLMTSIVLRCNHTTDARRLLERCIPLLHRFRQMCHGSDRHQSAPPRPIERPNLSKKPHSDLNQTRPVSIPDGLWARQK